MGSQQWLLNVHTYVQSFIMYNYNGSFHYQYSLLFLCATYIFKRLLITPTILSHIVFESSKMPWFSYA